MFFNILKNGCKVEALQLSAMPRIELALSLLYDNRVADRLPDAVRTHLSGDGLRSGV